MTAGEYNRATYDRIWAQLGDFIRYNPGARHRRRNVFELLGRVPFTSLLDVGCGNGELLRLVDARWPGRTLAGTDLSGAVIAQNTAQLPHMSFSVVDVEHAPLPTGFDVVTCCEVIEHLDDQAAAMQALARAVRPGGHLLLTCPTGKIHETERRFGHVRHPSPADFESWARTIGMRVVVMRQWGFPLYALTKAATNVRPDFALDQFAGEKKYRAPQRAISTAAYLANFLNLDSSKHGVQLFVLLQKETA